MNKKPDVLRNKPEDQPTALWNSFKRVIKDMGNLTDEQIAAIHYESYHAAFVRTGGKVSEE